jgi:glyoxylase-like metal-dependent hydrolase (beta-lactamase superfamily II)
MEIYNLETGNLKLDGGAMFGVVPKSLWQKVYPADENNLITLAMRSLLVIDGDQKIIIDTGIGDKQDEKFLSHYYLNGDDSLAKSLEQAEVQEEEITDVILTHLHFDHCGGAVKRDADANLVLTFPNATYHTSEEQWNTAVQPNARERASFLKENILPIQDHGKLSFVEDGQIISDNVSVKLFYGHTSGQVIPFIRFNGKTLVYIADVVPAAANIPLAWITAYDMEPTQALLEKENFLIEAVENDYTLFFEHDIYHECCTLKTTEKGIRMDESLSLEEWKKQVVT